MITFEQPLLLLLLVPVSLLIYFTWRQISLPYPAFQRALILFCRSLLFLLIILALAGTSWTQSISRQSTVFVGDISASTTSQRAFIEQWITKALKTKHTDDQVGIVAFGRNALVEQAVDKQLDFSHFESAPDTNYTDLAAGLRLAAAILPNDTQRHIILLTDGQQNLGDALQEAQLLQQQGIRLDIVSIPTISGTEARIDGLDAPTTLHTNERFVLHARVYSSVAQQATLRIYLDNTQLSTHSVKLAAGQQDFSFSLLAPPPGFHTFRMTLEAASDTILQNNEASAFVSVQGPPTVLVVEGQPGSGKNIVSALKATGIQVETIAAGDMPATLEGLAKYGSIVLADVPAALLGNTRMQTLQSFVRDLGHGLVVSGGENSYGLGSYADTPLEQTLPVRMDIPQHKETPSIAVVLIVESLESDVPINISKEAAKGVISFLTPHDMVGISAGYGTLNIPMQKVTDRAKIKKAIDDMNPTDPPSYAPDLLNAEKELLKTSAQLKHIILLGDGDAFDPVYASTVQSIAKSGVTISTVATNSMSAQELGTMRDIAYWGKGRFYQADDPTTIPQILLQETKRAARRSIITEKFNPAIVGNHPILTGLKGLPQLSGYIATTPKATAQMVLVSHLDDPVLAIWQYGLGRAVAWTSDALGLWTQQWLTWNEAARWWANLVTWSLPAPSTSALQIHGQVVNGLAQLTVDLDPSIPIEARQQQVSAHIIGPDGSQQTIALQPVAPQRWQGGFPTAQLGAYLVQVTWQATANGANGNNNANTNRLFAESGLVVPYSPEFHTQGTDIRFLQRLAQLGGGRLLDPNNATQAFTQPLAAASASTPITFWLLMLAAILLPIDIAARRLAGLDFLTHAYRWLISLFKPSSRPRLATATQAETLFTNTPLDQLRTRRQTQRPAPDAQTPISTIANKALKNSKPTPPPASSPTHIPLPDTTISANSTNTTQPPTRPAQTIDDPMASRLLEAKRKRKQDKNKQEEKK